MFWNTIVISRCLIFVQNINEYKYTKFFSCHNKKLNRCFNKSSSIFKFPIHQLNIIRARLKGDNDTFMYCRCFAPQEKLQNLGFVFQMAVSHMSRWSTWVRYNRMACFARIMVVDIGEIPWFGGDRWDPVDNRMIFRFSHANLFACDGETSLCDRTKP